MKTTVMNQAKGFILIALGLAIAAMGTSRPGAAIAGRSRDVLRPEIR